MNPRKIYPFEIEDHRPRFHWHILLLTVRIQSVNGILSPFSKMALAYLVLDEQTFTIPLLLIRQTCGKFAQNKELRYSVQEAVSPDVFQLFIDAINSKEIRITNDNVSELKLLCAEFEFVSLSSTVSTFENSPDHQICVCQSQLSNLETKFNGLLSELSSFQNGLTSIKEELS
jgi:hypothetical protein